MSAGSADRISFSGQHHDEMPHMRLTGKSLFSKAFFLWGIAICLWLSAHSVRGYTQAAEFFSTGLIHISQY